MLDTMADDVYHYNFNEIESYQKVAEKAILFTAT